jgi:hypothetical protein
VAFEKSEFVVLDIQSLGSQAEMGEFWLVTEANISLPTPSDSIYECLCR